jgi:hypothetical protein
MALSDDERGRALFTLWKAHDSIDGTDDEEGRQKVRDIHYNMVMYCSMVRLVMNGMTEDRFTNSVWVHI